MKVKNDPRSEFPMCGFIAQLVEHRTGIAEVTGSNPVEALIFFRLLLSSCLNWKIHCEDHSSLLAFLCSFLTRGYPKGRNGFLLGLRYANVSLAHSGVESS